ncbi:MAG: hypothetical protein JNL22_16055 [Bacteroidales bacterium]|jgi:hypothetical protein|nr:hypothetical protein [Bacteroidales bacterium]
MKLPIRRGLFWDVDVDQLDEQKHRNYIVQQVLSYGNMEEFRLIIDFYGINQVKESIKQAGYFDPKTVSFITGFFNIRKEEMQCYTKRRLNQPHWI